ncbi:hypothetical protein HRH25_18495 [Flavisolibacter sp. BT320]|nr:hypothetical protein [Flavisolibacter longurius]
MNRFLILAFEYSNAIHYCLIRYKAQTKHNEYAITIMNGELEKVLFGQHVIFERDGFLFLETAGNEVQRILKEKIAVKLSAFLNIPLKRTKAKTNS